MVAKSCQLSVLARFTGKVERAWWSRRAIPSARMLGLQAETAAGIKAREAARRLELGIMVEKRKEGGERDRSEWGANA